MKFNIYKHLESRPLSWSAISSFEWDKEQWARNYLEGKKEPANPAMLFGHLVGQAIAQKHPQAPKVPYGSVFEYKVMGNIGKIPMIGYLDSFTPPTEPIMDEYKTHGAKGWDQKRVDEHKQLDMYSLLLFLQDNIRPQDLRIRLSAIPVKSMNDFSMEVDNTKSILTFETKRTMQDILRFGSYIENTVKDMEEYANFRMR